MDVSTNSKAVNSKLLYESINELIRDGIFSVDMNWRNEDERGLFIDYLNSLLHEYYVNGVIEQWKIQCNGLNNKAENMLDGTFILDVSYKQKHCLNTTQITYTIQE